MKKSSFVAMVMGVVSGLLFALGMCMVLLPEWNRFWMGFVFGGTGLLFGLVTLLVWRKMENKAPIKLSGKVVLNTLVAVIGALVLGAGMCFVMVWEQLILGIIIGTVGIIVLLSLVPLILGFKN